MNTKLYANLHTHSTHSEGVYTPEELVKIAKAEGYKALAISDHDTATAYPELKAACEKEGLESIFAVEFSVTKPKGSHIVGFDFDPEYPPMKEYLAAMGERQTDNTKHCFEEAVENGNITGITWEEVLEYNKGVIWLCNDHVFRAMEAKGLVERCHYAEWFNVNFAKQRAKYPPCRDFMELKELVAMIKAAGGFAVVAHPHNQLDDIDFLIECGVEGLEVWHSLMTPKERERGLQIAKEKNLYVSGGSDHEGLCGGMYLAFPDEEELKKSEFYIEPLSTGTTEEYFREIQTRKKNR